MVDSGVWCSMLSIPLTLAVAGEPGSRPRLHVVESVEILDPDVGPALSFDDFYREHVDPIARALSLTLGDGALGREATDEAFTRAYAKWGDVSGYANPEGWVYRVGLNWARSWHRRATRVLARRPDPLPLFVDATEVDVDLQRALDSLREDHRAVVVLRYLADWSTEEAADALDIAPGTVKSRLSRALEQLRNELGTTPPSTTPAPRAAPSTTDTTGTDAS